MDKAAKFYLENLDNSLANLIWDQWSTVGGSGSARKGEIPFVVDIEALILATTRFGRWDPRIFDQCTDWLARNGRLVSIQRLKNIQSEYEIGDAGQINRLGQFMVDRKFQNWKSILSAFSNSNSKIAEVSPSYSVRGLSRLPDPYAHETFLLKLRNFFGVSARAEVFLWLLTHDEPGHPARIARDTAWLPKTIQLILNEWEQSGLVSSSKRGRENRFSVITGDWTVIMPKGKKNTMEDAIRWFHQPAFFAGCSGVRASLEKFLEEIDEPVELQSMTLRKTSDDIKKRFEETETGKFFVDYDSRRKGRDMIEYFLDEALQLGELIHSRAAFKTRHWNT